MREMEFWDRLEYRISREFAGLGKANSRGLWCDGLIPERYELNGEGAVIYGIVWLKAITEGTFALFLRDPTFNRSTINWDANLPPDDVTDWLEFNLESNYMVIRPGNALSDA